MVKSMLTKKEMDKAILEAKKSLSDEQMKDALRKYSYGGKPADMSLKKGGEIINGKTNA